MNHQVLSLKYAYSSLQKRIENKQDMYDAYFKEDFGNQLRTWENLAQVDADDTHGTIPLPEHFTIRSINSKNSKHTRYRVPSAKIYAVVDEFCIRDGVRWEDFTFNESAPDDLLTIQGEVYRTEGYLYLRYSKAKLPMREALRQSAHAEGYTALAILQTYLDSPSMENLNHLLDIYDGSIVEFTSFSQLLGTLGWNTVFWEVRNY